MGVKTRMLLKAKIWNNGQEDWVEEFQGTTYRIPGKSHGEGNNFLFFNDGYIANRLMGQYFEPKFDGSGKQISGKPLSFEKIVEEILDDGPGEYISHIDGKVFRNRKAYEDHMGNLLNDPTVKAAQYKETETKAKEVEDLKKTVAELSNQMKGMADLLKASQNRGRTSKGGSSATKRDIPSGA